ncbi:MAG TPA: CoA transferase, partial [Stellaceae bacterium]|nr:CoA transferase [Stellaceae bacterium]
MRHPSIAPYGAFATGDGSEIIIAIQNEREWLRLCAEVLERPELGRDPRFADNNARVRHREVLDGLIAEVFARFSREALGHRLLAADIAFAPFNSVADFAHHPQLRRVETPTEAGPLSLPAPPLNGAGPKTGAVPALGAHSAAIRREFGG